MPEVWKALGLRHRACQGHNVLAAVAPKRETHCHLHGMLSEKTWLTGQDWLKNDMSKGSANSSGLKEAC
jgi:hypothetical protein